MTIFKFVKYALDQLYKDVHHKHGASCDPKISESISYLRQSYFDLKIPGRPPIRYAEPETRFAYVYKYTSAHGAYIVRLLTDLATELNTPIFKAETLRLTCLGGGPGSDIIGVLKYLSDAGEEKVKEMTCYLVDGEQAWVDTWTELEGVFTGFVPIHMNFQHLDVTKPNTWEVQREFLQADLFTVSYFVSEVKSLDGSGMVTKFWDMVFREAKPGALFLYIDNGGGLEAYFDKLWKRRNLVPLIQKNDIYLVPPFSERSSELAEYNEKFGHNPKLRANVSYRVLRKPNVS